MISGEKCKKKVFTHSKSPKFSKTPSNPSKINSLNTNNISLVRAKEVEVCDAVQYVVECSDI
jgi:hypothetical protein